MLIKKISLGIICLICLAFAFHQTLVQWSIQFYLSHAAEKSGITLSYDSVQAKPNQLILNSPMLVFGNKKGKVIAESVTIAYAFHPFEKAVDFEIDLFSPEVELGACAETIERITSQIAPSASWFKTYVRIKSHGGQLKVNEDNDSQVFQFNIDHCTRQDSRRIYSLRGPDGGVLDASLDLGIGQIHAREFPIERLTPVLHALFPFSSDWALTSGVLNGDVSFQDVNDAKGLLIVHDLVIQHKKSGIKGKLSDLQLSSSVNELIALEFVNGAVTFADSSVYGMVRGLKGKASLDYNYELTLASDGIWSVGGKDSHSSFDAKFNTKTRQEAVLEFKLDPLDLVDEPSLISLSAQNLRENPEIKLNLINIESKEFAFAQRLLDSLNSDISPIRYVSGKLNASATLKFIKKNLTAVSIHQIDAKNLFLSIKPLEIAVGAGSIAGQLSFDMAANSFQQSVNASLNIDDGKLVLTGINADLWDFTHIQTKLEIKNGAVQGSSASVELAGLKGQAKILQNNAKEILHLSLSGKGADLKPFVNERIQNGIDISLADDDILLTARVKRRGSGVGVEGVIETKSIKSEDSPPISFGFSIERENALLQLKDGRFIAEGILLDKFIDPFLFPDRELELSGLADLEGRFDEAGMTLHYGGSGIKLKNDKLIIEIPLIEKNIARQTFNFNSGTNYGYIPLVHGTYFDRSTGLYFSDIQSRAILKGCEIHFEDLEAYSNNLYFRGTGDIDYSSEQKGAYVVKLHADTVDGSFSAAQQFFEHFERPFFFTKVPLEGVIEAGKDGVDLTFDIKDKEFVFFARVDGVFSDGRIICPNADLSLQELSLNFTYDQLKNKLQFQDIQGMVLLGKPDNIDEYSLHAENIIFTDFSHSVGSFDVTIKDATSEFIRIKGNTHPNEIDSEDAIVFDFDLVDTHFGVINPKKFELKIIDWNRIDHLNFISRFEFKDLLHDFDRFGSSEIFWFSRKNLEDLKKMDSLDGEFALNLGYEGDRGVFEFNVHGQNVKIQDYAFKEVNFSGYNRADRWIIEQFKLDQLSAAAELTKRDDKIIFDFLGIRFGELLLLGLEGAYRIGDKELLAKANLFEVDLSKIDEWDKIKNYALTRLPQGKIKGSGQISIRKSDAGEFIFETAAEASIKGAKILGASLSDESHAKFRYLSTEGFALESFKGTISHESSNGKIGFNLEKLNYEFAEESLKIGGLNFAVDSPLLPWAGQTLNRFMPKLIDKKLAEQIGKLKQTGTVRARVDMQSSSLDKNFQINFEDGIYYFFGEERNLANLTIESQQEEIKISTIYTLNRHPIWMSARLNPFAMDRGSILLADAISDDIEHPALIVEWRTDSKAGVVIEKAEGYLAGLDIHLKESAAHASDAYAFRLAGSVDINGHDVRPVLPSFLLEAAETLKFGKGYNLQGEFEFGKGSDQEVRFFGKLMGQNIELKGYQFDHLSAHMILEPTSCQLLNCTLSDLAGNLHIANLRIDKVNDEDWVMQVPLLTIHEMRPSILQNAGEERAARKPLLIREMYLQNIVGTLGNTNSFTGDGQLNFINPQIKYTQNVLFSIPSEILTRIGLNLSVLTPVNGTVQFELKQGHFVLKKLKDVYSEGKISKFYLPTSGAPSTVSLDGKANVQVRFKQSTLLLKLAEPFTITVKGAISDPRYSLQRQKYLKQEEVFSSEIAGP